jgi:hypothetical protein
MKIYRSKIGPELIITLSIILGSVLGIMVYGANWPGVITVSATILFVGHLIMTTYYQIQGNQLTIKSGFFFNETVDITTIKKVVATRNIISAPAASLDRLELMYNRYDSVLVSPKDKAGFINELIALKPDIVVTL